ncbi:hypothetical protein [Halomonas saccharevitans]|uniref:hypothetical protein n=1 Tax=Halomonas saccharevitans TaxID=416872 RepID=UPI0011143E05|nr:hypothetical protein [Halomonas saccharevitans]
MKNSSDSLSVLYAVVGFVAGYVLKKDGAQSLFDPFAGTLGIFVSSILAGGINLDGEHGLGAAFVGGVMGFIFVMSVMLVVGFIYSVILTAYRESKRDMERVQSTS